MTISYDYWLNDLSLNTDLPLCLESVPQFAVDSTTYRFCDPEDWGATRNRIVHPPTFMAPVGHFGYGIGKPCEGNWLYQRDNTYQLDTSSVTRQSSYLTETVRLHGTHLATSKIDLGELWLVSKSSQTRRCLITLNIFVRKSMPQSSVVEEIGKVTFPFC